MYRVSQFYIGGKWVAPSGDEWMDVLSPATETVIARLAMGNDADVDRAVQAARAALPAFSSSPVAERIALLERIVAIFERRSEDFACALRDEMGAPISFARTAQTARGPAHLNEMIRVLRDFPFQQSRGSTLIRLEPVGVCGLITPWNWPVNQVVVKVAPALAAGCTMVLKPSEFSALSALLFAEVLDEAGTPPGVFNLVNGLGPTVGHAISTHSDINMVSFTGSKKAGVAIARAAADTVKRVTQELGGKSANILLSDVDFEAAVTLGVTACFANSGQSCAAPTRMLVPAASMPKVVDVARRVARSFKVGPPEDEATQLGPLVNRAQFDRVQRLIQQGIDEGATLVAGGTGLPDGISTGYFVKPTIFSDVNPEMTVAREEIFGPVLSIIPYRDEQHAIAIANGTTYGLAAHVQSADLDRARRIAIELEAGNVHINYPAADMGAPFGGYKQSGNGREWGEYGLREYLELKAVIGFGEPLPGVAAASVGENND